LDFSNFLFKFFFYGVAIAFFTEIWGGFTDKKAAAFLQIISNSQFKIREQKTWKRKTKKTRRKANPPFFKRIAL